MGENLFTILAPYVPLMNIALGFVIIYSGRHKPARDTIIWLMILALMPIVGFILYLLFGTDTRTKKIFQQKEEQDALIDDLIAFQLDTLQTEIPNYPEPRFEDYWELVQLNLRTDQSFITLDNEVDVYTDGMKKFNQLMEDIDRAQRSIEFQYYIVKSDELGKQVLSHLISARKRGVHVRFLVDGFGNRRLKKKDVKAMEAAGIETAIFHPSFFKIFNFRMNYRNHRKLVVIDDFISYIGGFNVGDEYVGRYEYFGYWRDTHLRMKGSASLPIKERFLKDWYYASGTMPLDQTDRVLQSVGEHTGDVACQLVTSGPDSSLPNIKFALSKMIASANKAIYIQTPYFLPDTSFFESLCLAIAQGVEVYVMIPCKRDHPVVYPATMSFAGDLLRAGGHIYRYEDGFLHAKTVVIDDFVSLVGSANMDERSFALNFEASEIVYSYEVNRKLRQAFQRDVDQSTELTLESYENRPLLMKIKEPVCRLFAPVC